MARMRILEVVALLAGVVAATPAGAADLVAGAAFLVATQQVDGSWSSMNARDTQVTSEALSALHELDVATPTLPAAAEFLASTLILDTDDRAHRIPVLAAQGIDVSEMVADLIADAAPSGGWGLTPEFQPDPLTTALALTVLADQPGVNTQLLARALTFLIVSQRSDGRVHRIGFTAADGHGGTCTGDVTVCVPHDRREGGVCVDQGPLYDATVCADLDRL